MSVLLKRWVCLDDGEVIANEAEYRFHSEVFPGHRIVVDENPDWKPGLHFSWKEPIEESEHEEDWARGP